VAPCKANEAAAFNDLLNAGREMSRAPIFATGKGFRVVQVLLWILNFSPRWDVCEANSETYMTGTNFTTSRIYDN
jgi:hypothetical protein